MFMNNTELKNLLNQIKPTENEKNEMKNAYDSISNIVKNNIDGKVKVAEIRIGGSYAKGTIIKGRKEIDMVVVISPKNNRKLYYKDLANLSMNSLENALYLNYYDKLKDVEPGQKITRNYTRNTLSLINTNGVDVDFLVKFKKEQLLGSTKGEVENFYLERDDKQLEFIDLANKDYTLFKNCVMLLKHFRNENNLHQLKSYMVEIMLYYSLVKYSSQNTYTDYLTSFFKGLKDFIDKKIIEVDDKMYNRLGVKKTTAPSDAYRVLDVANRSNNVAVYITASDVTSFNNFYNKYKNYFTDKEVQTLKSKTEKNTRCEITYVWYSNRTEVSLSSSINGAFKYESERFTNNADTTFNNGIEQFYKHLLRIIRIVKSHKLCKNILIVCHKQLIDVFEFGTISGKKISEDIKSKLDMLKQRSKQEGITISFNSQ